MEYAKDEIFNIKYENEEVIRKDRTSSLVSAIQENKFIKLVIGMTLILCVANFICIYNFFSILSKL